MIQNLKHLTFIVIISLFIASVFLLIPRDGQAQDEESTPTPEATPLTGPTPTPNIPQIESFQQLQSSTITTTQRDRGLDPETLTAYYHNSSDLDPDFFLFEEPWKKPIDFYKSCYEETDPFESCKIISALSNGSDWSVQWDGTLVVPEDGRYTFSLPLVDDGARVFLNYGLVIDSGWNWPAPDTQGPSPQTLYLYAGEYDIRIQYEQRQEYAAAIQLRWSGPGFEEEIIPIYDPFQPPPYSLSLYWQSITPFIHPVDENAPEYGNLDTDRLREFGCSEAKKKNGPIVVVLFFGDPVKKNGVYYTRLPSSPTKVKLESIEVGVQKYISGYWDCSDGSPLGSERLVLAVGITNSGDALNTERNPRGHGEEWGKLINRLREWVQNVPVYDSVPVHRVNYSSRVSVVGAFNIEKWKGKATTEGAIELVEGYSSITSAPYLSVQACEDCETDSYGIDIWGRDAYWRLAWGQKNAYPLPMIYNQALAEKWQELSKYGATCQDCYPEEYVGKKGRMYFYGSFTQELACENSTSENCYKSEFNRTDFSPDEGWRALYTELYSDPITRIGWMLGSTDIGWDIDLDPSE